MAFDALLGNTRLKENLARSIARGHISHCYLLSGPRGSGKRTLARLLAAAAVCQREEKPCLTCPACRKALEGTHPDYITVEDPEHKNLPVRFVRDMREDVFIRPNEASRKVYQIGQTMLPEAQNALLKILEEPPAYGVFLLLTENPEALLPTVRSRCTELKLQALPESLLRPLLEREFPQAGAEAVTGALVRSGGFLGQARELLGSGEALPPQTVEFTNALANRDALGLAMVLAPMERWKRDDLIPLLQGWLEITEGALACRAGMPALSPLSRRLSDSRSPEELHRVVLHLRKAADYAMSNVSPGAVCGYLSWALR